MSNVRCINLPSCDTPSVLLAFTEVLVTCIWRAKLAGAQMAQLQLKVISFVCFLQLSSNLQTDIAFLERQINQRKQKFGVEVYELMDQLELDTGMSTDEKEAKIRLAFDSARKDIAITQAKIEVKQEEMAVLENESKSSKTSIPPSDGVVLSNGQPMEEEYGLSK